MKGKTRWSKRWYEKNKAAGLCARCGSKPPIPDGVLCPECAAANRTNNLRRYHLRREAGICPDCTKPVTDGYARCGDCRAILRDYMRSHKVRQRQRADS